MTSPTKNHPVIFIHGLWIHSTAWQPWRELFESRGYATSAPGWPGDSDTVAETRANPDAMNGLGIDDLVQHYADHIGTPKTKPLLVGHSFGGLVAQELLAAGHRRRSRGHRPGRHQGRQGPAPGAAPLSVPGAQQPRQPPPNRLPDPKQFSYAFGNTRERGRVRRPPRRLVDPRSGAADLSGGRRELRQELADEGRHPPGRTRTPAPHLRYRGPRGALEGHPGGLRALPGRTLRHRVPRVRRTGALAHHRLRLVAKSPRLRSAGWGRRASDPQFGPSWSGLRTCGRAHRRPAAPVAGSNPGTYEKALTARAMMRPKSASAIVDCTSIRYFARCVSGITSVGLKAVALVKPR